MDRFSPVAPAYVRVLVLPVGKVDKAAFNDLVRHFRHHASAVPLKDLQTQAEDDAFLLSPLHFPRGTLLLNFETSEVPEQHQQFAPFELWRETLLVLGVASIEGQTPETRADELKKAHHELKEKHGRVVHRHLFVLEDGVDVSSGMDITSIPTAIAKNEPALRLAIKTLALRFLAELSTYAKAMQASPSIQTPGQASQGLLRSLFARENDERPRSNHSNNADTRSPEDGENTSRPNSRDFMPPPATTFDQMAAANTLRRSDSHGSHRSKSRPRTTSFDRLPVHALSKEKIKDRGRARVGIVTGSIYLLAGQWSEALKLLVDNTIRLRALSDHIWHGKGLEHIFVCMLLHAWADIEFQVPSICYQLSDKVRDRFSKAIVAEVQKAVGQQTPLERLATSAPELLRHILLLYHFVEGTIELPYRVVAEATIRFCKVLAVLYRYELVLTRPAIANIVNIGDTDRLEKSGSSIGIKMPSAQSQKHMSKTAIADLLSHALPMNAENASPSEHISILTGIATVYGILGLQRKRAITLKTMVARLTEALHQARKLGAAEMGIHPAASLSIDNGTSALLESLQDRSNLSSLSRDIASIYGVNYAPPTHEHSKNDTLTINTDRTVFGDNKLQVTILQELLRLSEAAPDLQSISDTVSAVLNSINPHSAIDAKSDTIVMPISPEEQSRMLNMMLRASWLSNQLDVPTVQSEFWDPFLVRGITLLPRTTDLQLHDIDAGKKASVKSGNPLLYDPNAPKVSSGRVHNIMILGESNRCSITLQNPLDVALDIENFEFIGEGVELKHDTHLFRLEPHAMQNVIVNVTPLAVGESKLTGCKIKIGGCREKIYSIITDPWTSNMRTKIKFIGQDILSSEAAESERIDMPKSHIFNVEVVPAQPRLSLQSPALTDSRLMLLDGEKRTLDIAIRNVSEVDACILQIASQTSNVTLLEETSSESRIAANAVQIIKLQVIGSIQMKAIQVNIVYASVSPDAKYARHLPISIGTTTPSALCILNTEIRPICNDRIQVQIDMENKYAKIMHLRPSCISKGNAWQELDVFAVSPGDIRRINFELDRWRRSDRIVPSPAVISKELFDRIRLDWTMDGREGQVPATGFVVSEHSIRAIHGMPLRVAVEVVGADTSTQLEPVLAGAFVTIRVTVVNHHSRSEPFTVQLNCVTLGIHSNDERRTNITGNTRRIVPAIASNSEVKLEFAVCPLLSGMLDITATVTSAMPNAEKEVLGRTDHALQLRVT